MIRKILLATILAGTTGSLLSACVAYEVPARSGGPYYGERDRDRDGIPDRVDRDRDGDGVRNSRDFRPDDARRY